MKAIATNGSAFARALIEAGVIPPNCRRAVIDMQAGQAIKIFCETFADAESLESEPALNAALNLKIEVSEQAPPPPVVCNITINGDSDPTTTAKAVADYLRNASSAFGEQELVPEGGHSNGN